MSRLVVALGGNALLRRGQPLEAEDQRADLREADRTGDEAAIGSLAEFREVAVGLSGTRIAPLALETAT